MSQLTHDRDTQRRKRRLERGFTLIELIVATAILAILVGMAVPLAKNTVKRERKFKTKVDSQNYPPDLDTLVKGEDVAGKKLKFLRKIPVDPMTNKEWGMRSMQDEKDSDSWGEPNVFDVYTKSDETALDGTKYKDW